MATTKQTQEAKRNVKKAQAGARRKRSIANMPAKSRTALGKQGAAVAQRKRTGGTPRRAAPSSIKRRSGATCPGARRWAGTSWPGPWAASSAP